MMNLDDVDKSCLYLLIALRYAISTVPQKITWDLPL